MKNFISIHDVEDVDSLVSEAFQHKADPYLYSQLGKNKTLGLIFLNPSLRTRLSTQKAGINLGMQVITLNGAAEAWNWELSANAVMDGSTVEHIKDAAKVISQYCDIVGIRSFARLTDQSDDYNEFILSQFIRYCDVPVISLESATRHPLQSLADIITIRENWKSKLKPKVVLTWAPHVKPLPQAVANSFVEWMLKSSVDLHITHPPGYELNTEFTNGATITYSQKEALKDADFVYVKSWSAYQPYGSLPPVNENWLLDNNFLQTNSNTRIMHCLPVRRNVELKDALIDSPASLIYQQAFNRTVAAQTILKRILENGK